MSTIFEGGETPQEQPQAPTSVEQAPEGTGTPSPSVQTDSFADLLGTVVNEQGEQKYTSVPEAMKGLAHSQQHIRNLEQELADARTKLEKSTTVEDALNKLTQEKAPEAPPTTGLDEEAVAAILEQRLSKREQERTVTENLDKVNSVIQDKFGDKAKDAFFGKAKELGMTNEQFKQLAATSPKAVLAYFDLKPTAQQSMTGSVNTTGFEPKSNDIPTIIDGGQERISLPKGEGSVLVGATSQDLMTEFQRHKAAVYKKHGLTL